MQHFTESCDNKPEIIFLQENKIQLAKTISALKISLDSGFSCFQFLNTIYSILDEMGTGICCRVAVSNRISLLATFVATGHLNCHMSIFRDRALILCVYEDA